jgi:hypothetical protein
VQGLADAFHIHPHRIIQVTQQNLDNQFKNSVESKQSGRLVPGSWVVQILGCISKSATIPCNYRKNPGLGFWAPISKGSSDHQYHNSAVPRGAGPGPRCDLRLSLFWQKPYTWVSLYLAIIACPMVAPKQRWLPFVHVPSEAPSDAGPLALLPNPPQVAHK